MLLNKQPVQQFHTAAISHFMKEGRIAFDAANPATLALINFSPDFPSSTLRPFKCA
jgi:hypothetical protein